MCSGVRQCAGEYAAVCGRVCGSMRESVRQCAGEYAAVCGRVCGSVRQSAGECAGVGKRGRQVWRRLLLACRPGAGQGLQAMPSTARRYRRMLLAWPERMPALSPDAVGLAGTYAGAIAGCCWPGRNVRHDLALATQDHLGNNIELQIVAGAFRVASRA